MFEKYVTTITLGGKEIKLNLYDTAGKTLYEKSPPCRASLILFRFEYSTFHITGKDIRVLEPAELSDRTLCPLDGI